MSGLIFFSLLNINYIRTHFTLNLLCPICACKLKYISSVVSEAVILRTLSYQEAWEMVRSPLLCVAESFSIIRLNYET